MLVRRTSRSAGGLLAAQACREAGCGPGGPPYMPDAEIIAVGSEMLTSQRLDTNSLFLTDHLNALGVEVKRKLIVGDDRALLTTSIREAVQRFEIVIVTGGLGPTEDDVTRDAVASALGREMVFDQTICDGIQARFRLRGRVMPEINKRQSYL